VHLLECTLQTELEGEVSILGFSRDHQRFKSQYLLVSPASPEKAIKVWLFSDRVLSSVALRMVAPLIAAFEAAMRVKSLPVMPRRTSLHGTVLAVVRYQEDARPYILSVLIGDAPDHKSETPNSFVARLGAPGTRSRATA
jgi:hypothetical protein